MHVEPNPHPAHFEVYPTGPLMPRCSRLRGNVTTYNAWYIALAEVLGVTFLMTDANLARTPAPCTFKVI